MLLDAESFIRIKPLLHQSQHVGTTIRQQYRRSLRSIFTTFFHKRDNTSPLQCMSHPTANGSYQDPYMGWELCHNRVQKLFAAACVAQRPQWLQRHIDAAAGNLHSLKDALQAGSIME
jgi:hypothetical protein